MNSLTAKKKTINTKTVANGASYWYADYLWVTIILNVLQIKGEIYRDLMLI